MRMIIVTHEVRFAREVADRIVFMDDGVIVEEGSPGQLLDQPGRNPRAASCAWWCIRKTLPRDADWWAPWFSCPVGRRDDTN